MAGGGRRRRSDFPVLTALAGGASILDAAAAGGVSERTVRRRLQDPDFVARLGHARDEMARRALGVLVDAGTEAAETLRAILADGTVMPSTRIRAAVAVLELGSKLRE